MRKLFIIILILFLFAVTINFPKIDITGLFIKATSTILEITRVIVKQILTFIASKL